MNGKLKILMQMRPNAFTERGGDTVVMEHVRAGLIARGHQVDVDLEGVLPIADYELVQIFNFCQPAVVQAFSERCFEVKKPYVATCMYEDWPAYFAQMMAMTQALGRYVVGGQPAGVWQNLEAQARSVAPASFQDNSFSAMYAEALIASGNYEALSLRHDYPFTSRIRKYHCGSEISDEQDDGSLFIKETGIKDFVLCVGRLETRKNQLMLLKALEDSPLPLVFLTGGFSYQAEYEQLCRSFKRKGETHFIGRLDKSVLASAFAAARLHVLPSWQELPGIVSLEAARYGTNVVATDYGTIRDYLGEDAFYCRPDSADSIRQAVQEAYDAAVPKTLKERAMTFTWDRTADEHLKIYEEVLDIRASYGWASAECVQTAPRTAVESFEILLVSSCANHSKVLVPLARLFAQRGHKVSFLSLDSFFGEGATDVLAGEDFEVFELEAGLNPGGYFSDVVYRALFNLEAAQSVEHFFSTHSPDAVVLAHDQPSLETLIIRAAQRGGAVVVRVQHGVQDVGVFTVSGGSSPFVPGDSGLDLDCVWGERLAQSLRLRQNARRVRITGNPRFDRLRDWPGWQKRPGHCRVLLAAQNFAKHGRVSQDDEVDIYRTIIECLLKRSDLEVWLRLHPAQTQLERYQELAAKHPGRVSFKNEGDSLEILREVDALVTISSTISVESVVMGIPTYSLDYFIGGAPISVIRKHQAFLETVLQPNFPQPGVFGFEDIEKLKRELSREIDGRSATRVCTAVEEEIALHRVSASQETRDVLGSVVIELDHGDGLDAVRSVLCGSEIPYEVIVIDRSVRGVFLERMSSAFCDRRLRIFHRPGADALEAFAFGVEQSRGEIVIRLHADCVAHPGWVEAHIERLLKKKSALLSLSHVCERDETGIAHQNLCLPEPFSKETFLRHEQVKTLANNFAFRKKDASTLLDVSVRTRAFDYEFVSLLLEKCTDDVRQVVRGTPTVSSPFIRRAVGRAIFGDYCAEVEKDVRPSLSVIVNGSGGIPQAKALIAEIEKQSAGDERFEVLFINNALGEELRQYLRPMFERRKWQYFEALSPACCADVYNQAVSLAKNEVCVFLDGSSMPATGYFEALRQGFVRRDRDSLAICSQVRPLGAEDRLLFASAVEHAGFFSGHLCANFSEPNAFSLAYGDGLCVPRSVFSKLGLSFNINYPTRWAQNYEFAYQLWRDGYRFFFVDGAVLTQVEAVDTDALVREELERAVDAIRIVRDYPLLSPPLLGVMIVDAQAIETWTRRADATPEELQQLSSQLKEVEQMPPPHVTRPHGGGEELDNLIKEVANALRELGEITRFKEILRVLCLV